MKNKAQKICVTVSALMFAAFAARLADWQLIHGGEYRELAARAGTVSVATEAVRGEILDRNGKGLVTNTVRRKIVLDKSKLNIDGDMLLSLIAIVERCGDKWEDSLGGASAEYIDKLKKEYGIADGYTAEQLRKLTSVYLGMSRTDGDFYTLANDVSKRCVSEISEQTQGIDGVETRTYHVRSAVQPTLAPHILGSVGAISAEEYDALSDKNYKLTDSIGKFGIEAALEDELRGRSGRRIISGDDSGSTQARRGNTVVLTLDSGIQEAAVRSLGENIAAAESAGARDCESGAAVMLDVSDFSVLAAASCPTYDLNRYSSDSSYYLSLAEDEASPMFNRACSGSFACGSVFKPCVALAALDSGVITPETEIYCARYYDYYPTNVVACMHYHGSENLFTALAHSCNVFFAETGRRLGIGKMYSFAEKTGLGEYTGLETEESRGFLAGRDSETWTDGNTVQAAIGQSDNAFTPMQLAAYTATIANGGRRMRTHLVKQITDYSRREIISQTAPREVCSLGIKQAYIDDVKKAMLMVTQDPEGTAYSEFSSFPVAVGAKTGTAENAGSDHAAFICFAPFDRPEVAVAVIIEHGADTKFAMRTAKDMLRAYFDSRQDS